MASPPAPSVEQKLSGSHKALVEMQDLVAELLRTAPREAPATKVRGGTATQGPPARPPFHAEASLSLSSLLPSVSLGVLGGSSKKSCSSFYFFKLLYF